MLFFHRFLYCIFFFFNDTATTEIYTLSLHDALPICRAGRAAARRAGPRADGRVRNGAARSEEHTSELQSQSNLVCRLLLEKKKHNSTCSTESTHLHPSGRSLSTTSTCAGLRQISALS